MMYGLIGLAFYNSPVKTASLQRKLVSSRSERLMRRITLSVNDDVRDDKIGIRPPVIEIIGSSPIMTLLFDNDIVIAGLDPAILL
jgi:hypothetical protein